MELELERTIEILERTPRALRSLLDGLPDAWTRGNEGPETFSPFDVLGHLIHGEETDWIPRAQIILEHGASRPFTPFDRFAFGQASNGKSLASLLDTFESLRANNIITLRAFQLGPKQLDLLGTHPELGSVTLRQLLATWVVHDLGHLGQIARVMAKQYGTEVGPWKEYLPILTRR
jgi:DinB superfamily